MITPAPSVSVVICGYTARRWDALVEAVGSVRNQQYPVREILVVADHNPDLAERARHGLTGAVVLENEHARGLSGARNTGLAAAGGDVVAFLDDDAVAEPDWLTRLLDPYRDPAVVAVGGVVRPRWMSAAGRPALLPAADGTGELDWVVGCSYTGQPVRRAPVRNVMGCNMSLRRAAATSAGGFVEGIGRTAAAPLGCEETELCIRMRQQSPGCRIVFEPSAVVHHRVEASRTTWAYLRRRSWAEGLSKAAIGRLVGSGDALASEWSYTTRVLPAAITREFGHGLRGRPGGWQGAAAIAVALLSATAGVLRGKLDRAAPAPAIGRAIVPGMRVRFTDDIGETDIVLGTVQNPSEHDRRDGYDRYGSAVAAMVLVAWDDRALAWELQEDLVLCPRDQTASQADTHPAGSPPGR